MHLFAAIFATLLRNALLILALMALLFAGFLLFSEISPTFQERWQTTERLEELQHESIAQITAIAAHHAQSTAHLARQKTLHIRLDQDTRAWQENLDRDLALIEEAAQARRRQMNRALQEGRKALHDSAQDLQSRYCDSWNPVNWWACYTVRQRVQSFEEGAAVQRQMAQNAAQRLQEQAEAEIEAHRQLAAQALEETSARLQDQIQESADALEQLATETDQLQERLHSLQAEEEILRKTNWLWLEFRNRWRKLFLIALLILAAPFLRRTLWYFVGMPLVSRARPIELAQETTQTPSQLTCSNSARTLAIQIAPGEQLRARSGYIQSDRLGAKSELFFDRKSPNLSYRSGLVLLTRLEGFKGGSEPRKVLLGAPHDPAAYLMQVDLKNHPGLALRASRVVAVIGDVNIRATWRIKNLHAWATSQLRFLIFSGTGTLILEGYGDVQGSYLENSTDEKRMPLVIGFDTRLSYKTRRAATFLPYLIDPGREPLVVDVFEGTGTVFFEKNPSARARSRSTTQSIADFFLDALWKLLGI